MTLNYYSIVHYTKRNFSLLFILLCFINSFTLKAQQINNDLLGYFTNENRSSLYSSFQFDGNGHVLINEMGDQRDFFTFGDSLIIYPDKSIFKFIVKKDTLNGVSLWVNEEKWIKKDTIFLSARSNNDSAKKTAALLYAYYGLNKNGELDFDFLVDVDQSFRLQQLNILCNQGLSKACLEILGIMILKDMGGIGAVLTGKIQKPAKENAEIVSFAHKIIAMGAIEAYSALGSYFYTIGQKEKAYSFWNEAIAKGSTSAAMLLLQVELENEADK